MDFERSRSGRADRVVDGTAGDRRKIRRRLLDLTGTVEDPDSLASSKPGAAEALESEERRHAVERALDGLPPRDRLLIKLRFEDLEWRPLFVLPAAFSWRGRGSGGKFPGQLHSDPAEEVEMSAIA